jgi:hypothetical protein
VGIKDISFLINMTKRERERERERERLFCKYNLDVIEGMKITREEVIIRFKARRLPKLIIGYS